MCACVGVVVIVIIIVIVIAIIASVNNLTEVTIFMAKVSVHCISYIQPAMIKINIQFSVLHMPHIL